MIKIPHSVQLLESQVDYLDLITFVLVASVLLLSSCSTGQWLTDVEIGADSKTPQELIELLGPPAKIDLTHRVPLHKGKVQEYRYFVLDRSGRAQYRRYFYDGSKWLTESLPYSDSERAFTFRVIDPEDRSYLKELGELFEERPDLRP